MNTYGAAVAYLAGLEGLLGWDLGLERMRAVCARQGHPERRFATVHIAGTNGKGSTSAMVEASLRAAGYRTGLYTSPHLVDFAERIRAGGHTIPRARVADLVPRLRKDADAAGIRLTHFEFVTLLAFAWFAEIGVQIAVIEVGLGGRLDATNVVTPIMTAITSIALDHEQLLGGTLAAIAGEKAGIAKAGVPLVLADGLAGDARMAIATIATAAGAPLVESGRLQPGPDGATFTGPNGRVWDRLSIGLRGEFQARNAATALTVLATLPAPWECSAAAVRAGVATAEWPGRLAVVGDDPLVLLDGAHNPAGAAALAAALPSIVGPRRVVLVFAVMEDKAAQAMLTILLPLVHDVIVTRVGRRGLDPARIVGWLGPGRGVRVVEAPRDAVAQAIGAAGAAGAVVAAGSLFLVGEGYAALRGGDVRLFPEWQGWEGFGTGAAR